MRRETIPLSGVLVAAGFAVIGCQAQSDPAVIKKLDEIAKKLEDIEKKVGAGGRPSPMQPPPGPDPNAVYAVPIAGSAYEGPEHAKVTIVEAYEYA